MKTQCLGVTEALCFLGHSIQGMGSHSGEFNGSYAPFDRALVEAAKSSVAAAACDQAVHFTSRQWPAGLGEFSSRSSILGNTGSTVKLAVLTSNSIESRTITASLEQACDAAIQSPAARDLKKLESFLSYPKQPV